MSIGRPLGFGPNNIASVEASLTKDEMLCPDCDGAGIVKVGHSFTDGNLYESCFFCRGAGKCEIKEVEDRKRLEQRMQLQRRLNKLPAIVKYEHHGTEVFVQERLKGKHREHCLCFQECMHFKPGEEDNCEMAQANYELCVKFGQTTPVYECPKYQQRTMGDGT